MNSFEKFINSDGFYPVLILLLVALIGTLIWVIISSKNKEKKNLQQRKNKAIDETQQIKIITKDGEEKELTKKEDNLDVEENTSDEIKMIVELNSDDIPKEKNDMREELKDVVFENQDSFVEDQKTEVLPIIDEKIINKEEVKAVDDVVDVTLNEEAKRIADSINIDTIPYQEENKDVEIKVEEKELKDENGDYYEVPNTMPLDETNNQEKSIDIEKENATNFNDEGEEIEVVHHELEDEGEEVEIPVRKDVAEENINDAFAVNPSEDHSINENIKVDLPNEYVGEKTEIFDFPDFDKEIENVEHDVEQEILDIASKYIESIMKK